METKYLTTKEVAEQTGKSLRWIQTLIKDGRLPVKETVKGYLIKESDVSIIEALPKPGRPLVDRWKGYSYFSVSDLGNSRYKVEFGSGIQQARGAGQPSPRVPDSPSIIVDIKEESPKFERGEIELKSNLISSEEFQLRALEIVEDYINSNKNK